MGFKLSAMIYNLFVLINHVELQVVLVLGTWPLQPLWGRSEAPHTAALPNAVASQLKSTQRELEHSTTIDGATVGAGLGSGVGCAVGSGVGCAVGRGDVVGESVSVHTPGSTSAQHCT